MELEKDNVFKKYKDKLGELMTGEVYQIWKREMLILDEEGNELILPKTESSPGALEVNVPEFIDLFVFKVYEDEYIT